MVCSEQRARLHQGGINDGASLLQRQCAPEEQDQAAGQPCSSTRLARALKLAHRESELEARLTLERVGRFECDLFGRTHTTRVRAAVQEAADGDAAFGGEACPEQILCERKWSLQKSFYTTP